MVSATNGREFNVRFQDGLKTARGRAGGTRMIPPYTRNISLSCAALTQDINTAGTGVRATPSAVAWTLQRASSSSRSTGITLVSIASIPVAFGWGDGAVLISCIYL